MSKKRLLTGEVLPSVDDVLASAGLRMVPEPEASIDMEMPSWVDGEDTVPLPPNLLEQLSIVHRERDAALAVYQQHENRRGGLFDGFLFALSLPQTATYDLATGVVTIPKAE